MASPKRAAAPETDDAEAALDVAEPTAVSASSLYACAEQLVAYLKAHPAYAESATDWYRCDQALRVHADGNHAAAWSQLMALLSGAIGAEIRVS